MQPLDQQLGHLVRLTASRSSALLSAALAGHGVTAAEWTILRVLFDGGAVSMTEVSRRAGLTAGAVTRLVKRLRAKNLVVRVRDSADRRARMVALTGQAARLVPALAADAEAAEAACFGGVDPAVAARLASALRSALSRRGGDGGCDGRDDADEDG